jgi:hypothetical protein
MMEPEVSERLRTHRAHHKSGIFFLHRRQEMAARKAADLSSGLFGKV